MMTGLLHEREFSRKTLLKGGGALIVAFSALGASVGATAAKAAGGEFDSNGPYDSNSIDSWLAVHSDNTVSVKLGMIELGQGSTTGLLMIAAEELDLPMSQVKMISNDTDVTPNQGGTYGSQAVHVGGMQTRAAAAAAHATLLRLAAKHLGVAATSLSSKNGVVSGGGKHVTYGELIGGKLFNVEMAKVYQLAPIPGMGGASASAGPGLNPAQPPTKSFHAYDLVGTNPGPPRIDIPAKVVGTYTYVQNVVVPNMLHGRLVRPRGQGGYGGGTNPKLISVDARSIRGIPGARVVRKGNFLGVVAQAEYNAIQAAALLRVTWAANPPIAPVGNLYGHMRSQDVPGGGVVNIPYGGIGDVDTALASAAKTVKETFSYSYNGHFPIGPSCAVADVTSSGARVFTNSQDCYASRDGIQAALKLAGLNLPVDRIRVTYVEGSSVYGTSPYDDANQSAAVMSHLAGAPVRLQWMRWDEQGWDHYAPAQLMDVHGGIDGKGNVVATDFTHFSIPFYGTEVNQQELGVPATGLGFNFIDTTNMGSQYSIPNQRVTLKQLPLIDQYFSTSFMRAPLAPGSVFAYEQLIDMLAHEAKMDPVAFRLQNMTNRAFESANKLPFTWNRWRNVLTEVARLANWRPRVANSVKQSGNIVTGRGIALGGFAGTMAGIVAEVSVNKSSGKVLATHLYGAQDTGFTVYIGGVENQAVGSMTQGLSRALHEAVIFNKSNVTSLDWVTYPILRFQEAPPLTFRVIQRKDIPSTDTGTVAADGLLATGSGEPPTAPIAAALANAVFDATGVRIPQTPLTPPKVRYFLRRAGVT